MQTIQPSISVNSNIAVGFENSSLRYEVVKKNDRYQIELIKHWVSVEVLPNGTVTRNNRLIIASIDVCLHQNEQNAGSIHSIGGAVARAKALATETGIPMTVNLPN